MMKLRILLIILTIAASVVPVLASEQAAAQPISPPIPRYQNPAYQIISREIAVHSAVEIQVASGRVTTINFNQTNERITYVLAADPSRLAYTTNAELRSGQAKALFLRTIQRLKFPGATSTAITNLSIQTTDATGRQRLYTFNVVPILANPRFVGVAIVPDIAGRQILVLGKNRSATLNDIEAGLSFSIRQGYTDRTDPIVLKMHQFLALSRSRNITMPDAAAQVNVPFAIVLELAKIALDTRSWLPVNRSN